ncbi:HAMP domain-containing sensor histidine kinase [Streptomyces sp. NPDC005840]|uniref:sensor histidine kinase n=1 Tax=Streptomyces sp. NPDC005840 TaxID=3157072 RepID=UPI0033D88970
MNAPEPRRRWWPRSVRALTALAAASTAAVVLAVIGLWVHHDVRHRATQIAEEQAQRQLWSLCDQLRAGIVPDAGTTVPYEVVATGRRSAVASGGSLADAYPASRHVMPAPPTEGLAALTPLTSVRIPVNRHYNARDKFDLAGGTQRVMTADIRPGDLGAAQAAALGVDAGAKLRVYVVVLPHTAEEITDITDRLLLGAGLVSVLLVGAAAYAAVRVALRPVEAIRVRTASVTASDPRERVTVPATGHEIAALATTINTTLQRLDDASARQRRFVADAAHELRSPLTTLLASLEVALAYPERTDWPAAATTAARQTRRLQALAEDLLLLARLGTRTPGADPDTVDLAALAAALAAQHPLADRPLTLTCESTGPAYTHGTPGDHERLLRNLVDNAARHAEHRVRITVRDEDPWVVLTVHDDGPGVPAEEAERVFERFVRLDDARSRDHGGTGLGLAIARDLAESHGGTLILVPGPGTGTGTGTGTGGACFRLRLPRAAAPSPPPSPDSPAPSSLPSPSPSPSP